MRRVSNLVITLIAAGGSALWAADFLPLAPGNNWAYRDAVTGASFTVSVGISPVFHNEQVYHELSGYTPAPLFVRADESGNILYWDEERQTDSVLTSFTEAPGVWFEAPGRVCREEGQIQQKRGVHDGPAGPWQALEIRYRVSGCADVGDELEQYVENIGMVRRVVTTFAGPRTFDLVSGRIGSQVISAGSAGSFIVSVLPGSQAGTWQATLRVDLSGGQHLKLQFPSSQEYDLRLRDADGKVLWTWSADKLFAEVVHEREVAGFSAAVTVPFPPSIPEGPHIYTLEAWLTSAQDGPQFAAAVNVETPSLSKKGVRRSR